MRIIKGIPVSPGVAICPAAVLDAVDIHIPRRTVPRDAVPGELARLDAALDAARVEVDVLRVESEKELGPETAAIFGFHLGLLRDKHLIDQARKQIEAESVTAQYAFATVMRRYAHLFQQKDSPLFRERVADVWDVERRVLRHLVGKVGGDLMNLESEAVIVTHDLTPSQTATLNKSVIKAIVTEAGGRTSHTAIVARALSIPCVVGLEGLLDAVKSGDKLLVDGHRGLVIVDPEPQQIEEYERFVERLKSFERKLVDLQSKPPRTLDGTEISLQSNIEFTREIAEAVKKGAKGIGLYRTEYLFLANDCEPSEETQFQAYVDAIRALDGLPMTLRTLDLGADKGSFRHAHLEERNPFLGLRSIRFCLQNLTMFKTHLRAILRASAHGPMRIMFPLITNVMELRQAKMILNDVMEDLDEQGVAYNPKVPVGIMIEVPSAAIMAKAFIGEVDFFSIGTNDLVQYTLAVDRTNEHVASLYSDASPAVISLLKSVMRAAKRGGVDVSCCGEMAGDVEFVMLLIGLGLRTLSMTPQSIPGVKQLIRNVSVKDCERVARRVASYDTERQVLNYLREETRKMIPEAYDGRSAG